MLRWRIISDSIMQNTRHAIITSIVMLTSAYAFGDIEKKNIPVKTLLDRGSADSLSNDNIPIILTINDNVITDKVWLSLDNGFTFIFADVSTTLKDLAGVLNTLSVSKQLKFSCSKDINEYICNKYEYFIVYFDFDRGDLNIKYRLNKDSVVDVDSSPLAVLSHNTYYSESRAGQNIYRNGMWNGFLTTGLSQFNTLMSALRYDFSKNKFSFSEARIEHEDNLKAKIASFFTEAPSNTLSLIGGRNVRGVSLTSIEQKFHGTGAEVAWEPIIIESDDDGIFNIYDGYDNVVSTLSANKGINIIQISPSVNSERVKINLIVDGKLKESFDRINRNSSGYDSEWDMSMGVMDINTFKTVKNVVPNNIDNGEPDNIKNENVNTKNDDSVFLRGKVNSGNKSLEVASVPSQNSYAFSASYNFMRYISTSIDSSFYDKQRMNRILVGHSNTFSHRSSYFANFISNFSNLNTHSFNSGVSHSFKNNDTVNMYFNTSSGRYGIDKRLSASYSTNLRTMAGGVDLNIYSSSNLASQNSVGLSVTFRPLEKLRWLEPSARLNWQKKHLSTQLSNKINVTDYAAIVPELEFGQGMSSRYGALANLATPYQSIDGGFFSSAKSRDINISSQGAILVSKHGIQSTSGNENVAYHFINNASDGDRDNNSVAMSINNNAAEVKHKSLIKSNAGGRKDTVNIYSDNNQVRLDAKYQDLSIQPYRVYNIDYHYDTSLITVSGRVINDNTPQANVKIINNQGTTRTNDNGYFSFQVSKLQPHLSFNINDKECHNMVLDVRKSKTDQLFLGRIPCQI